MSFAINIPTRIISGRGCAASNPEYFKLGKHAAIVSGRSGAAKSGALKDIAAVLDKNGIDYTLFNEVGENPALEAVCGIGRKAVNAGCDFVIGIGGGSAMDAAKAVSALAANPGVNGTELYNSEKLVNPSLPLILIPTTAGTGSEANPYSVLTLPDGLHKKTFTSQYSWPRFSFVDPTYTESMSRSSTFSTALDAFAHAMESYSSPKSNDFSRMLAVYASKNIWNVISEFPDEFTSDQRDILAYSACAAGAAISITGTGFPHPLGYSITLLYGIPHGSACAVFHGDYIKYNSKNPEGKILLENFAEQTGTSLKLIAEYLPSLADVHLELTADEISKCVELVKNAKNYSNSPYVINADEMTEIYNSHFLKK